MRSITLMMLFSILGLVTRAQLQNTLAYVQTISPGTVSTEMREPASREHYFIYLTFNKLDKVVPVEAWIRGKHYNLKATTVGTTPVEMEDRTFPNEPKKIVLVPKTSLQVLQMEPAGDGPVKMNSASARAKTNELVVVYKLRGKMYTTSLKKLIELPAPMYQ